MAGYSGTPLVKKLGLNRGTAYVANAPADYFDLIAPLPDSVQFKTSLNGRLQFIHLFATRTAELRVALKKGRAHLVDDGQIWVSWPKKSSGIESELDENLIRNVGLEIGLVDVKVCAIDQIWSGLKFVIPLKDRE